MYNNCEEFVFNTKYLSLFMSVFAKNQMSDTFFVPWICNILYLFQEQRKYYMFKEDRKIIDLDVANIDVAYKNAQLGQFIFEILSTFVEFGIHRGTKCYSN